MMVAAAGTLGALARQAVELRPEEGGLRPRSPGTGGVFTGFLWRCHLGSIRPAPARDEGRTMKDESAPCERAEHVAAALSERTVDPRELQRQEEPGVDLLPMDALPGVAPKLNRRNLLLLMLFRVSRGIAAGMMAVALPYLILKDLGYGSLVLGAVYTTGLLATAGLGLAAGHLADVWSRKGTLLLTGLMVPVSALLVFAWPTLPVLFAASVVGGFAATGSLIGGGIGGAAQPVQSAVIADLTSLNNRTLYYSLLAFLSGLAGAGGALLVRFFSVQNTFLAAGLIAALGVALLLPLRIPGRRRLPPREAHSRRAMGQFTITGALNGFSQGLVTPFLIPFFVIIYHMSKSSMAVYTAVATLVGAIALLTAPVLEKRLGFVRSIAFTRALGTALLVLMAVWHQLWPALAIYVLSPALRIAALPAQQTALTSRVHGGDIGRALATNQVARQVAASGAILCTGYLFDLSAIETPFFLYAAIMAVNIGLYFRFFGQEPAPPTEA